MFNFHNQNLEGCAHNLFTFTNRKYLAAYFQAIATNPTSVFLIGSLVASTVIASQLSSFALVGQTLTFDSQQGGLIR